MFCVYWGTLYKVWNVRINVKRHPSILSVPVIKQSTNTMCHTILMLSEYLTIEKCNVIAMLSHIYLMLGQRL